MNSELQKTQIRRNRRRLSIRKRVRGTTEKPRLSVSRTNQHLFAQLIDDEKAVTIASAGTMTKDFKQKKLTKGKEAARKIGALLAEKAKQKKINAVVFDRGHYKYHGLLAELANAAREAGLQF